MSKANQEKIPVLRGKVDGRWGGFSLETIAPGASGRILAEGFFSPEHGDCFYDYISQIGDGLISRLGREYSKNPFWSPDVLSAFLIVMHADGSYELYPGSVPQVMSIRAKHAMKKGSKVTFGEIGDINKIEFQGVTVGPTDSVIYFFTVNWRHGLYFDFRQADPEWKPEMYDASYLPKRLARHYLELAFAKFYREDEASARLQKDGWFPFLAIAGNLYDGIYDRYRNEPTLEKKSEPILKHFDSAQLTQMIGRWWDKPQIAADRPFIESALKSYLSGDNISAISVLYPRIEGVLRRLYLPDAKKTENSRAS